MSPYLMLLPAFVVMASCAWMSYQPFKAAAWFPWVLALFGAVNVWLWAIAARLSTDARQLFTVGCVWDVITLVSYTVLPLMLCGVRLSPVAWCGLALVVVGVALVKWG